MVSPNGTGNQAFAEAALAGRSGVKRITRFDPSDIEVQIAGEVANFDELAWVEKKERKHVSRVLPLALCAATEALQTAGFHTASLPIEQRRRFGVIIGTGGGSQEFTEEQYRLYFHGQLSKMSLFCIPTGVMGSISSELNVRFNLRGPSHVITTGCTSSTDAIAYSMRQIESGRLDAVLTGGADAPISLGTVRGFTLLKIITEKWNHAPEKGSRPFSADRDGFVVAEGAWMLVLEEYEHARARGAKILAEVCGYGSTCEAFHRVRLMECGEEPSRAIALAMKNAGIGPADVDHINAHGVSSKEGDAWEARGIRLIFGGDNPPILAVKSYIGNLGAASGSTELVASLLAFHHGRLPSTLNYEQADPRCPVRVAVGDSMTGRRPYAIKLGFTELGQCAALAIRRWEE